MKPVNKTIFLIEQIGQKNGIIKLLDLNHDLGNYAFDAGDAIKLLDYLAENEEIIDCYLHNQSCRSIKHAKDDTSFFEIN